MPFGLELAWRRPAEGGPAPPPSLALGAALTGGAALAATLTTGSAEQAETTALVGRMTVAPTAARRGQIDAAIAGLKADGVWPKLDWLVLLAAHDAQAARLNWRAAKALAAVNSPVFTADRGFAGNGATAYLDFGEAADAAGNGFVLNSATLGVWVNQPSADAGAKYEIGSTTSASVRQAIAPGTATDNLRLNNSGSTAALAATRAGHRTICRSAAATIRPYLNGVAATPIAAASAGTDAANLALLKVGTGTFSNDRLAAAYSGAALSDAEVAALHGRLNTYLTALGAN